MGGGEAKPRYARDGAWHQPGHSADVKDRKGQEIQEALRQVKLEQNERINLREEQPAAWKGTDAQWRQTQAQLQCEGAG